MTAIIPRRLFDDPLDDKPLRPMINNSEPRPTDMVDANASITVEFNERLKAMARKQGKTAKQLIGELLMDTRPVLDKWEAKQEATRLRERFGENWMQLFQQVE